MSAILSHFHTSPIFAVKTGAYPSGAPYSISNTYLTRVEVIDSEKQCSLLRYGINYDSKKFYSTGPRNTPIIFQAQSQSLNELPLRKVPFTRIPSRCGKGRTGLNCIDN